MLPGTGSAQSGDAMQSLADAARREGEVVVYTSLPLEDMKPLADAFERRFGVRAKIWRASSEKVLQRTVAEGRSGRNDVDVVETNAPELEALTREKLLQPVRSDSHANLIPHALPAHRAWAGTRLTIFASAYNTKLVRADEVPKRWDDLAHPRWKGRLGIEADDVDWFASVVQDMGGEQKGAAVFRDIVRANGMSIRRGHTLLTQLVVSGEVPLALTVYNYKAEQLKQQGAPIEWFVIGPAIARANGIGIAARPRNPNAARLFYEFVLGEEGQRLLQARELVPTHRRLETALSRMPLRLVDTAVVLDDFDRWKTLYDATFGRGTR